ncbi:CPBP family intramembrane glutamic endopeptidase [Halocynthiibacter namhaensis]|uniref:CPBP family intramembrane glutamic endopeptidase n=1 Tax=Halocynthiibacter namhaensis TaxID=1290553 RepID=UPI0009E04939|nr:CPBP family intramembrane glutamic endopeptidase [Halocynthiibacter namhaensis]
MSVIHSQEFGIEDHNCPRQRRWLFVEFSMLFVVVPLAVAIWLPPTRMFTALALFMVLGLMLLLRTPGFSWRIMFQGWSRMGFWPLIGSVAGIALAVAVASYVILSRNAPDRLFAMLIYRPDVMLMIAVFYPLVSALPQELIFRVLFFRRYKPVIPSGAAAIWLNAALFSLAHLMYWSWIVAVMTFIGGLIFAWAYKTRESLPLAIILHSVAGVVLFAFGMGVYFYSGAVVRPF